jgi:ribosomal protein S6--L-glutamate ligase
MAGGLNASGDLGSGMDNLVIGWREWAALPKLGLPAIKAKIDTGARTSALHAFRVESFGPPENPRVRFWVHPVEGRDDIEVKCTAKVLDRRQVVSSNGKSEIRYIIKTPIRIGDREWPIEISLSNRETMTHRMLIGRTALEAIEAVVRPWGEFYQGHFDYKVYDTVAKQPVEHRPLRIALLTMEPHNYSNQRLVAAAEAREHVIEPLETLGCYININRIASAVHYRGKPLAEFDAVIPRIGSAITEYGTALVRQFELTKAFCLNSGRAISNSRNKLLAHQLMAESQLPMPVTAFASSPHSTDDLIDMVGGPPLVVKLLQSTQGRGVVLAETKKVATSIINAFRNAEANFLVQQFVADAAGQDIRCIVLADKVIAAMRRVSGGEDFRSNLHTGGSAMPVRITKQERQVAVKAAKRMGLKFAGVDLLRSQSGPLILEVNSSPGLQGIESVVGETIAESVMAYIEQNTFRQRPKFKKKSAA